MDFPLYRQVLEKFIDKGHLDAFHWLVLTPPPFIFGRTMGTHEEQLEFYINAVNLVYGKNWDEMNTWIDYQQYKF